MTWTPWASVGIIGLLCSCLGPPNQGIQEIPVETWQADPIPTDAQFVAIRGMLLFSGFLWVLDGGPPYLTRISCDTGEALRFGAEGEGPGELLTPWAIQPTPDSSGILVWDFGSFRVLEFGLDGVFRAGAPMSQEGRVLARSNLKDVSYADPFRVRSTSEGYLVGSFPRQLEHTSDLIQGSLRLSDRVLAPGPELARFRDLVISGVESLKEWASLPFWDGCGNTLVLWKPASHAVIWMDSTGNPQGQVLVEAPRHSIELQDVQRYLERMARFELGPQYNTQGIDFSRMARQYRDRFASERPFATDLRCQENGTAWIRLFDTETDPLGRGRDWIRVEKAGASYRVRTPSGYSPFIFNTEGSYGSLETPGGSQVIAQATPSNVPSTPHN